MNYDRLMEIVSSYEVISSSKDLTPQQVRDQVKRETKCNDAEFDHVLKEVFQQ
ncbi:MAG: hypothetical protein Q8O71_04275 [bacterium]|nr:hypothetical protein [bacterium]